MPETKTMRTARALLRLTEDEKRRLDELAAERNVSLSHALREGARLYLEDGRRWVAKAGEPHGTV